MKPDKRALRTFAGLRRVIATLRGPEGCPWDRVQTHESLRPHLLEEASEVIDALEEADPARLCEELGDLLVHVLIHLQIAEENGEFSLTDVIYGIADKLVRRHPHVFSSAVAETPAAVMEQWDEIKRQERGDQSALTGIPQALPALARAQALQQRAARAGLASESIEQTWTALEQKLHELRHADTPKQQREEIGAALFALVNLSRRLDTDAEDALRSTANGFNDDFRRMEQLAKERGIDSKGSGAVALWEEAQRRGD